MNKIKSTILAAAMLISALTLISSQAKAQTDPRTVVGPDTLANSRVGIPSVKATATLDKSYRSSLACGPASESPAWFYQGSGITLLLNYGQARGGPIGSWTVRSIYPAKPGRAATVASYIFDGTFTGGTVDVSGNDRHFNLRGTTTYSGSSCGRRTDVARDVRIWGDCADEGALINFEVTEGGRVYASGTFRGHSQAICLLTAESNIARNLNAH